MYQLYSLKMTLYEGLKHVAVAYCVNKVAIE